MEKMSDKKVIIILVILLLSIMAVAIFTGAYAKFTRSANGNLSARIAKAICVLETPDQQQIQLINANTINPQCTVKVKNYDNSGTTQVDVTYRINVELSVPLEIQAQEGFVMPEYYWEYTENGETKTSSVAQGTFGHTQQEEKQYKLVFRNPGQYNMEGTVSLSLKVEQLQ